MLRESKREHAHIEIFNPEVLSLDESIQNYLCELKKFDAGDEYYNFNIFLSDEAIETRDMGEGVTYVVWNLIYEADKEVKREIVAYYTLSATAIPYEDRIRLEEDEIKECGIYTHLDKQQMNNEIDKLNEYLVSQNLVK